MGRRAAGWLLAATATICVLAPGTGVLTAAGAVETTAVARPRCPAPVVSDGTATITCSYTGAAQYWFVPPGVTRATFTLYGAAGGTASASEHGGTGAEVTGLLAVSAGERLQVNVGQAGTASAAAFGGGGSGGGSGAGGGGESDIRDDVYTLGDRLLVAAGGGGSGAAGADASGAVVPGGNGGEADYAGGAGVSAVGACGEVLTGGGGGGAGTVTAGGAGGTGHTSSCSGGNTAPYDGAAGSEGSGGSGGQYGGGGGGGGYYGGGGGAGSAWDADAPESGAGGGGGGASYTGTAIAASVTDDPASPPASGNGEVIITYRKMASHRLTGNETAVSCLSASLCVAVGSRRHHGVVVTLTNGKQSHARVLRGSSVLDSVSCRKSGCWAIGPAENGARAYLVRISSAGRPSAERSVPVPGTTRFGPISCSSMTSCEVAGADDLPRSFAIEIGTWTGTRMHLHRVTVAGSQPVVIRGISCWHGDCEATGYTRLEKAPWNVLVLPISHGRPGKLFDAYTGFYITRVACVSAVTCYGSGGYQLSTVTNGVPGDAQSYGNPPGGGPGLGWRGIECAGPLCEAAGADNPDSAWVGVLASMSDGTGSSLTYVTASGGFTDIAARGATGFIAIGPGPGHRGTVATIG